MCSGRMQVVIRLPSLMNGAASNTNNRIHGIQGIKKKNMSCGLDENSRHRPSSDRRLICANVRSCLAARENMTAVSRRAAPRTEEADGR